MAQFQHLTFEERSTIHRLLSNGQSITKIALELKRDPKTISDEIQRNRTAVFKGTSNRNANSCIHRYDCTKIRSACPTCLNRRGICKLCGDCIHTCPDFVEEICPRITRAPFCCNGCRNNMNCSLRRFRYNAEKAQSAYNRRLIDSRTGIMFTQEELRYIDQIILPLVAKGQSIHHIYVTHKRQMICSEKTLYNLIDKGVLRTRNVDLISKVKRKRPKHRQQHKVDRRCHVGRTLQDFHNFKELHPGIIPVEMDCIEGVLEDQTVLLTLYWPHLQFLVVRVMAAQTAFEVQRQFQLLLNELGPELFQLLFPVILTDRGSEFSDPVSIEKLTGTSIFYCDPGRADQKPCVENANGLVRRLVPKGFSIQALTIEDGFTISSHLNAYTRLSLNNKSAYELVLSLYGHTVLDALHIDQIAPEDVVLTPTALSPRLVRKTYGQQ